MQEILKEAQLHLASRDAYLAAVIDMVGDCAPKRRHSTFEALVRITIGQQLSAKAASTIFDRVKRLNGQRVSVPVMQSIPDEELRGAGVSRAKIATIRQLQEYINSRRISAHKLRKLSDEEAMVELTRVRGIGPWSAQMYLMFYLQRLDIFPHTDMGIQNAITRLYKVKPGPRNLRRISNEWRPYRTVACWYLWRYLDTPQN